MTSRAKILVEMALNAFQQSSAEISDEQTDSISTTNDASYNNGYIELSPVTITQANNQECAMVDDPCITLFTLETDKGTSEEYYHLSPLIEKSPILGLEFSPAKCSSYDMFNQPSEETDKGTSKEYYHLSPLIEKSQILELEFSPAKGLSYNIFNQPSEENVQKIMKENSDGHFLQKCIVGETYTKLTDLQSDRNEIEQVVESESDGVRYYEITEGSSDSNDSDLTLQAIINKTKKNDAKEPTNEGSQSISTKQDQGQINNIFENNCRKRKSNTKTWTRNIRKQKYNSGKEYTNTNNRIVLKRKLKSPCNEKCRHKCCSVVTEKEREHILKSFWEIGDNTRQRQYISSNIEDVNPSYRYPKESSNRSYNQAYFLIQNGEKVRVCKKFFMATLDIGDTMIRTTLKKRDTNSIVEPDRRGKHKRQKKLDPALKDSVRNHINSIARVESHYLRNQTKREYFEGSLNITTLYRLYKEMCLEQGSQYVKKSFYEHIFNTEFNIGFHKPKKDQCSTCETYKNSNEEDKKQLEELHKKHLEDKDLSRAEKAKDVEDAKTVKNKIVAVYDLQAVLPTPSGEVSSFYYKSKLSTYNFTVYDIASKQGYCFVWSEHCAKRGANEIGTCVLNFLRRYEQGKSVVFFSDNCAGQNKNKFIASMYLYAVSKLNIPNITHKFLVTGHTQNEGDSMHSCIEREKKRVLKSGPIYIPSQWIPVIRLAKKNGTPYTVEELDTSDIHDFKKLSEEIGNNFSLNTKNEKVLWNQIKVLNFSKDSPYVVQYKYNYNDVEYKAIDVRGRKSTRSTITNEMSLKLAYKEPPKVSKAKKDGLLYLCNTKAIKEQYHYFYENLPSMQ